MTNLISDPASGTGIGTRTADGTLLEVWYPKAQLGAGGETETLSADLLSSLTADPLCGTERVEVRTSIASLAEPPADTADAYLRLHLLSMRLVKPRSINLDGVFGALPNIAWTSSGPVAADQISEAQARHRGAGKHLTVNSVDKFPQMLDYVIPSGVRIAIANRVRLGAYLSEGTTVMHEGFCNFNAGTLGTAMVEGRISQGVIVGDGSDVGGGASIMGTLSGGGTEIVTVGERCLVGANGGIGISLGNDCVVEAGCYVTAGTRVTLPDGSVVKASEVSGRDGLLFIRNSVNGQVEVRPRTGTWGELNEALHASN